MKFILLLFLSLSAFAQDDFFTSNNIILKSENIPQEFIDDFIVQFHKFPQPLMQQMLSRKAKIHLIYGHGVTDDPTWGLAFRTWDGRSWKDVPGAGGNPRTGAPTRIVVNRLHEGHGSVNLFLHEHAHALDSTYKTDGASNSKTWKALIKLPHIKEYLSSICKINYCLVPREAFAETFARYYESDETKADIIERAPEIAALFNELTSIKSLK